MAHGFLRSVNCFLPVAAQTHTYVWTYVCVCVCVTLKRIAATCQTTNRTRQQCICSENELSRLVVAVVVGIWQLTAAVGGWGWPHVSLGTRRGLRSRVETKAKVTHWKEYQHTNNNNNKNNCNKNKQFAVTHTLPYIDAYVKAPVCLLQSNVCESEKFGFELTIQAQQNTKTHTGIYMYYLYKHVCVLPLKWVNKSRRNKARLQVLSQQAACIFTIVL